MNGYFIQQHRYNSVKTGKSRTVSTAQKGSKALTTALKDTPVFQSRNPGMGRWTIPGFFSGLKEWLEFRACNPYPARLIAFNQETVI